MSEWPSINKSYILTKYIKYTTVYLSTSIIIMIIIIDLIYIAPFMVPKET